MLVVLAAAAASPTTQDRLKSIPTEFWWKMGLAIVALIIVVIVLRKVAKMNKVLLGVIVFITLTVVGFNWIYERNEPEWATPVVKWLAGFFPTKGMQSKNRP
jgi:apolipoprotein N-acyltransferase